MSFTLEALAERVRDRAAASPDESYTAKLLAAGAERCARKFGEEAVELIIAAATNDRRGSVGETADVLYHLLVLLQAADIPLAEVMEELERRTAQTGLEEKGRSRQGVELMGVKKLELAPYHYFTKAEWSGFRADEPMTLDADDVKRLRALTDPISFTEAEEIYLPLSRLISLYVEATQELHRASTKFLGADGRKVPYIIGVAGSVAVGKSTTSRILKALLSRWPSSPKVDLVTTDGFLFSNKQLDELKLADRKGFPESYDRGALIRFLSDIKSGKPDVKVPVYSHLVYDVIDGEFITIDRPDILIVEGLNILQPGELPKSGKPILFASDFLDFSIFIDADENDLTTWFMERFRRLRETAFADPKSFFHRFTKMSTEEAEAFGMWAWKEINLPNLRDNIQPTRSRADLVLTKGPSHAIERVALRKV